VSFPAVRPAKTTPYKVYRRDKTSNATTDITKQQTCIAAETGDVEFFSFNKDLPDAAREEHYSCQYVILFSSDNQSRAHLETLPRYLPALYDPTTNSLVVHPSTPTYIMAQRVKRLKALPSMDPSGITSYEDSVKRRTALGEAFGTKKAQSRIRAVERNKVNAVAQEKSRDHLMQSIGEVNEKLPMTGETRWT
jgi:DNA-directed RNA polymerase I subunit RPA49